MNIAKKFKIFTSLVLFHIFTILAIYKWIFFTKVNYIAIIILFTSLFYFIYHLDDMNTNKSGLL